MAFSNIDRDDKGYVTMDDLRVYLKAMNMYPSEKCMTLFY